MSAKKPIYHPMFNVSEIELRYKNRIPPKDRLNAATSAKAYDIFMKVWDMNKIELVEQFNILLLDRHKGCIGVSTVATGGTASCIVDPKMVFATALKTRAAGMILAHNHPTGCLMPSEYDLNITKKLVEGASLLDLFIFDHLIVSRYGYYSLADARNKRSEAVRWQRLVS